MDQRQNAYNQRLGLQSAASAQSEESLSQPIFQPAQNFTKQKRPSQVNFGKKHINESKIVILGHKNDSFRPILTTLGLSGHFYHILLLNRSYFVI